ncbi:hypothetical protein TNCV_988951 [Trichonephila clavipes]|nr:hypothetical protein TNCV_988951 [Trichonephila clavipes]
MVLLCFEFWVASSIIVELRKKLDASNLTALLTAHETGSSISNEVAFDIDSHFDTITESICTQKPLSVAEELDKIIKAVYAMPLIRFETLSSKIQKKMSLFENEGRRVDYTWKEHTPI